MSGVWGNKIKYSIFGESHGKGIGINIDGLPAGIKLDLDAINVEMKRRAPGQNEISTERKEKDEFQIISGYFNEKTTGTPLCAIIWNEDMHSKDYEEIKTAIRPGHADYTGSVKYSGFNDYRGGGHFSGRLTAPLVFAGAIAKQILKEKEIEIGGHIYQIADIYDTPFDKVSINSELFKIIGKRKFSVVDENKGAKMITTISNAKQEQNSVGGVIECAAVNLPEGLGSPFFDSVESLLAHLLFSIPGVKGVEFGTGFEMAQMNGSEANDEFYIEEDKVKTFTNHNGGILGGITNGMPLVFRVAFKPTASIGKPQKTIDIGKRENTVISVSGRHDPCIVQRALPVVEAVTAMVILDLL
ncbi:chorismate synthase [Clostridium sp. CS001]|uniref:chorismate synthase n=1 Tax=Clostridium sp. CS001 TaxID=2880648 RepID=UPI001CF35227|nr:chorismate synthase [Clostridium sp. CS001]MCB2291093.1 chorismate synthase [Clostridium sp. CS001]